MAKPVSTISVDASASVLTYGGHVKFNSEVTNADKAKMKDGGPDIVVEAYQGNPEEKVWDSASGPATVFPLPDPSKPDRWTGGAARCVAKLYGFNDAPQYADTKGVVIVAQCSFSVAG